MLYIHIFMYYFWLCMYIYLDMSCVVQFFVIVKTVLVGCYIKLYITIPGMTVNNCHGEVIVKRAFQRYLYQQLSLCFENHKNDSIFQLAPSSGKYIVKPGISFHMYVSTAPCGDARVFMPVGLGV